MKLFSVIGVFFISQICLAQVRVSPVHSGSRAVFTGADYQYNIETKKVSEANSVALDVGTLKGHVSYPGIRFSRKIIKPASGIVDIYLHMKNPKVDVKVARLRLKRNSIDPLMDEFIADGSILIDDRSECQLRVVEKNNTWGLANALLPSKACGIPGVFAIPYAEIPKLQFIPYQITYKTEVAAGSAGLLLREATTPRKQTLIWTGSENISHIEINDGEIVADFKSLNSKETFLSRNLVSNDHQGYSGTMRIGEISSMPFLFRDGHAALYIPDFNKKNKFRVERYELDPISKSALINGSVMEISEWTLSGFHQNEGKLEFAHRSLAPRTGFRSFAIFDKTVSEGSILHLQLWSNSSCFHVNTCLDDPLLKLEFRQNSEVKSSEFLDAVFTPELDVDLPKLRFSRTTMAMSRWAAEKNDYQGTYDFVAPTTDRPVAKFFKGEEVKSDTSCDTAAFQEARAKLLKAYPYRTGVHKLPIRVEYDRGSPRFKCVPGWECDSTEFFFKRLDQIEGGRGATLSLVWEVNWEANDKAPGNSFPIIQSCRFTVREY